MERECQQNDSLADGANKEITEIPADFDLISVDVYAGYTPGSNGMDEVTACRGTPSPILLKS